ncbi:MAG: histidine--tRNA ligase [Candidatus Marinimicrobia bacterium]|nr:histidine--tRNA ligase [Candidatus Neomarinimicrobiota bacterium]
MRDLLPAETPLWRHAEGLVHTVSAAYGYQEIRTPAFEPTQLFVRSVGQETDIVHKEMYSLEDQGGKHLTLKPELTAPVVRAYIENHLDREAPLARLYYLDRLFRQERPQKGRLRQFHQFGAEALGSPHPEQDVEIIALAYDLCARFQPHGLTVHLNTIGTPASRGAYLQQLRAALTPFAHQLVGLDRQRLERNPLRLFDSKAPETRALMEQHAPSLADYLSPEDIRHHDEVRAGLQALDIPFEDAPRLVRGLDYYTRTIFEITAPQLGAQDALCGGGRYDGLVQQLGGPDIPATGFAAGIERLLLAAGDGLRAQIASPSLDVAVVVLAEAARFPAMKAASDLRAAGFSVILETLRRSARAQLREANRAAARVAVIFGEEELAHQACSVKPMAGGKQTEVPLAGLVEHVQGLLRS